MRVATSREELLSALIRCDTAAHEFQDALVRGPAVRVQLAELAGALRSLVRVAEMLDWSFHEHWRATGYGLPPWLCTDSRHGARLAFDLLMSEDWLAQLTACLDGAGQPIFDEDDFELFVDVLAKLEETQTSLVRPRLLPGRIGDPVLAYRDLVRALTGEAETALAASSTLAVPSPRSAAQLVARFSAAVPANPIERELAARLLRVDVPVIHSRDAGMLLGLDVELTTPEDPHDRWVTYRAGGARVSRAFRDGVAAGHIAAIRLLESIGASRAVLDPVRSLRFRVIEAAEGSRGIIGDSAGLPIALHVIATALDLERPPWIATGSFEKDGTLKPIDDEAATIKARAVEMDGLWQGLAGRFGETWQTGTTTLSLTGKTLTDACAQVWPEAWTEARTQIALQYLADSGCTIQIGVPPDSHALTDDDGHPVGVRAAPHDEMIRYIREYPAVPVILAGPPSVGKSWTIRSIASQLEREGWEVFVLRFRDNHLPRATEAASCAKFALELYSYAERSRSLLVIEDLEASLDATDIESVLLEIVNVCQCVVSAVLVAQARSGLIWKRDSLHIVPHTFDAESSAELAESLISAFPQRFGAAAGCAGLVASASNGDRWWLVRLLDYVARDDNAVSLTSRQLRNAYLHDRAGRFNPKQWLAAEILTAYSEMGILAPARQLLPLSNAELYRLGAYRTVSGSEVFWHLPSPAARAAILCRMGNDLETGLLTPLSEIMRLLLEGTDMGSVVQCLDRLRYIYDARLLHAVSNDLCDTLIRRLKQHATAIELARAITLLSGLPEDSLAELVKQLASRLIHRGWPTSRASDLVTCLRALQTHDHLLARGRSSTRELDDLWEALLDGLWRSLWLLLRAIRPDEALGLLSTLDQLRRPELTGPGVRALCVDGLGQADPGCAADVFLAMTMASLARRISRREARQGNQRTALEELTGSDGWGRLIKPYRGDSNASDYLARLALRDLARPTGDVLPTDGDIEATLNALIPRTSLTGLIHTLNVLSKGHSAILGLLRRIRFDTALEGRINVESPHTVAQVLLAVARLQPRTAQRLLYHPNGRPRVALAEGLAYRVSHAGDFRMLSFLLEAVGVVDQEFYEGYGSFGEIIVARLMPMLKRIHGEPGGRVVNLTRGLISVDFDRKYIQEMQPQFYRYLVDAFSRSYEYRGGREAQLALLLTADDVLDGAFIEKIRDALDRDEIRRSDLLAKMKRGQTPDALHHYHALALALDPGLASSYSLRRPEPSTLVGNLQDKRLPAVLDAVKAVGRTLAYAGDDGAVHDMLAALADGPQAWAQRLLRLRHPGNLAKAVSLLSALDPQQAHATLKFIRNSSQDQRSLLDVIMTGRASPEEVLELLVALRSADLETGRWFAEKFANDNLVWRGRRHSLVEIDHPAVLGQTLHRLAVLGFQLTSRDIRYLEQAWSDLIRYMASPWTVGQLVRGVAAVDESLGRRLAGQVDAGRLMSRLARVRGRDGWAIGVLLRALAQAGRPEISESLAEQLASTSLIVLSPGQAVDICRAVIDIKCSVGLDFAQRLHDDVLRPALARRLVLDPDEHLINIGWLTALIRLLGCSPPPERWSSPGLEHPAARLWSETWLAPTHERTEEINDLLNDVARWSRPILPWRSAVVLIASARAGRLDDAIAGGIDRSATAGAAAEWRAELDAFSELCSG
jgi:hypothetical protein